MDFKRALITGVTGQDGAYLSEFLLDKGYEVHGIKRRSSSRNTTRIDELHVKYPDSFILHYGDMTDYVGLTNIINQVQPDELYNLAAQSHVQVSFDNPAYTADVDGIGTLRLLEILKMLELDETRFYQASTSELFGKVREVPQTEMTPFYPRSPYAIAKLYAYWTAVNYRESYGMFACNGILFNHESPMRGENFVTRKITIATARIKFGLQKSLSLGNLDAQRDWGFAGDYVEAMWLMLQQDLPEDYVIATGETHSVREFTELAFEEAGMPIEWCGTGVHEKGYYNDIPLIEIDPAFYRPAEVDLLVGNATKARNKLNWKPKMKFSELVTTMVESDLKSVFK